MSEDIRGFKFTDEATAKAYLAEINNDNVSLSEIEQEYPIKANPDALSESGRGFEINIGNVGVQVQMVNGAAPSVEILPSGDTIESEEELLAVIKNGGLAKLGADIALSKVVSILDGKAVILDLNGHKLTAGNGLKVNGGMINVNHGASLTVNGNGEIDATTNGENVYGALQLTSKDTSDVSKTASIIINGGHIKGCYYGIVGNGTENRWNTSVVINGGIIESTMDGSAIYNPQGNSSVVINNGELICAEGTAIEMRAGDLTINGGKLISNGTTTAYQASGSGTTVVGAAVAVSQHKTKQPIHFVMNGGELIGNTAFYEKAKLEDNISLDIAGGKLTGVEASVFSEDFMQFVGDDIVCTPECDAKYRKGFIPDPVVNEE